MSEGGGLVDPLSLEHGMEERGAAPVEVSVGEVSVLQADSALVRVEFSCWCGEDRQVGIRHQGAVGGGGVRAMAGSQDHAGDTLDLCGRRTGGLQVLSGELRAGDFVVAAGRVVHGVVEPHSQFGVGGMLQLVPDGMQLVQHRVDVFEGVVVAPRFAMPAGEVGQHRFRVRGEGGRAPRRRKAV